MQAVVCGPGAEEHVRARSRWLIVGGLVVGLLTFAMSWVWFWGFHDDMPVGFLLPLYAVAFGAIATGGVEYLSRPMRYSFDVSLDRTRALERQVAMPVALLDEKIKQRFCEGVAEGAQIRVQMTGTECAHSLARGQRRRSPEPPTPRLDPFIASIRS